MAEEDGKTHEETVRGELWEVMTVDSGWGASCQRSRTDEEDLKWQLLKSEAMVSMKA